MAVSMFDGTRLKGDLVGTDPTTDVVVIKVDPGKRRSLTHGSAIRIGFGWA
jgi:S1-C subfamily serine protease